MTVGVKKKLNISTLPLFMSYIYIVNAFFIYRNYQINNWKKSHKQNIFLTVCVVNIKKAKSFSPSYFLKSEIREYYIILETNI